MLTLCHNYFRVTPNNKNGKDVSQNYSRRKFAFGIFLLLLVVVLWVLSSEITKYLYVEKKLERPFLVTYVRSSLLFVYLILISFIPTSRAPWRTADYTQLLETAPETDDENFTESTSSLGDSTFVPVRAGETTDSDDAAPRAVRFNKVAEVRVMSAAMAGEALLARLSWTASLRASEYAQRRAAAAATRRHLRMGLVFCFPWFMSNYLYRVSLLHTSTSTATIYVSSTGALALSLGAVFAQTASDRLTAHKCVAVALTAAALVVLGVSEGQQNNWTAILSALGSAFFYALHLLLFRYEMRKGDPIDSMLLVGVIGCTCSCIMWAMGGALGLAGVEKAELPPPGTWSWLLADALCGPLLLEALWIWGNSLTAPGAAGGAVGLCAAAGAAADVARGAGAWRGAAAALAAAAWAAAAAPRRACPALGRRNIPELDEQSEALMSSDELT